MALSKLELQQMLREMNVKFSADETSQELKERLQQEHHNQWLKSVAAGRTDAGKADQVVVRKRKKRSFPAAETAPGADVSSADPSSKASERPARSSAGPPQHSAPSYPRHAIEKPAPGKPWKEIAEGTEPFNRKKKVFETVLRRAQACCEGCGHAAENASGQTTLTPFYIQPLDLGGEHSIKNVVALCPACLANVQNGPDPKTIKELKRKTRAKLYDSLQVVRKRRVRRRKR